MQQYYNNRSRHWRERFDTLSEDEKRRLKTNFSIPLDKKGLRQLRNEMEITKIAVLPEYQQNGIGTKLIETFITTFGENKPVKTFLEVSETNTAAGKLYEKLGFFAFRDYDIYMKRDFAK